MTSTLAAAFLCVAACAAPGLEPGAVWTYRGTLVAQKGDPSESRKSLELKWIVLKSDETSTTLAWTSAEQGHGGWPWIDRFGQMRLDAKGQSLDAIPSLLYERAEGKSVVGLAFPLLMSEMGPLRPDLSWRHEKLEYSVTGEQKLGDVPTWRVEARNAYGVRQVFLVDTQRPLVRSYRERVFIGQGQEFELQVELKEERKLSDESLAKVVAAWDQLESLRSELGVTPRSPRVEWNDKQLETLKAAAPDLASLRDAGELTDIVRQAEQDMKSQRGRAGAVASLRNKALGQPAGKWKLDATRGEGLDAAALADKVTVLHFWEYRDAPLEEPYGQIGFLDFLHRKRQAEGVQVYGVAVAEQLDDADGKRRAIQAANRIKSFMNLSYPVLLDDGAVLKSFGDPRVAGGKLPLFVVIGKNGKVIEYHAGLYEVQRDRGLEQLDKLITQALESRE